MKSLMLSMYICDTPHLCGFPVICGCPDADCATPTLLRVSCAAELAAGPA